MCLFIDQWLLMKITALGCSPVELADTLVVLTASVISAMCHCPDDEKPVIVKLENYLLTLC
jgi:hypothetical protein